MEVAIFVRVSKNSQDYQRQITDLNGLAKRKGYNVVRTISEKVSGGNNNNQRTGINELLALAGDGKIKKVLVTEISRLGRKTSEVLNVIERLTDLRISVYVKNYDLETLSPDGKRNPVAQLLFTLLAEFARIEREFLIERINSGLDQARRNGKKLGRPVGTKKQRNQELKRSQLGFTT